MALVFTKIFDGGTTVFGNRRVALYEITGDASYPTGGTSVTPGNFGLYTIDSMICGQAGGYLFEYIRSSKKIKAYYPTGGTGTGAANTVTPASGATAMTSTAAQPVMNISPGAGTEVANTTNLSTVKFQVFVIGT